MLFMESFLETQNRIQKCEWASIGPPIGMDALWCSIEDISPGFPPAGTHWLERAQGCSFSFPIGNSMAGYPDFQQDLSSKAPTRASYSLDDSLEDRLNTCSLI